MFKGRRETRRPPYRREKHLCTNGEFRFYKALEEAVGDRFTVMMQVRVGALLSCKAEDWELWGRKVSQKSFDFALVAKGSSFVAGVIELDDKTHLLPERRRRDAFLDDICKRAGLPLIRIKAARRYDVDQIRRSVKAALPKGSCEVRPSSRLANEPEPLVWVWKRQAA